MHMESRHEVLYIENSKAGRILCRIFLLQMPDWHNLSYNALQARHHTNVYSNNDICDAFFKKETITVSGNQNVDVKLTRPFAQVNIGTDDFDAATIAGLNLTQTQVKATAGDILNLATGKMEGTEATRTFKMKAIPTADDGAFPVAGYKYLLMAYIPISDTKETVDMTFGYNGKSTPLFHKCPIATQLPYKHLRLAAHKHH